MTLMLPVKRKGLNLFTWEQRSEIPLQWRVGVIYRKSQNRLWDIFCGGKNVQWTNSVHMVFTKVKPPKAWHQFLWLSVHEACLSSSESIMYYHRLFEEQTEKGNVNPQTHDIYEQHKAFMWWVPNATVTPLDKLGLQGEGHWWYWWISYTQGRVLREEAWLHLNSFLLHCLLNPEAPYLVEEGWQRGIQSRCYLHRLGWTLLQREPGVFSDALKCTRAGA